MILRIGNIAEPMRNLEKPAELMRNLRQSSALVPRTVPYKFRGYTAFTLVEMLVVLAIIGMLLGISLPFTSGFGKGLRIKTATRAIVGMLHVAKSNAITLRKNYSVVFDVENDQYWIEDAIGQIYEKRYTLPASLKFKVKDNEEADPVTFENDRVTFNPSGAIEGASGSVTFTDKQGDTRTISITGTTGRINVTF